MITLFFKTFFTSRFGLKLCTLHEGRSGRLGEEVLGF